MMRKCFFWLSLLVILWTTSAMADSVRIGVLAFRPKPETMQQWRPLEVVLKRALPQYDITVQAYTYPELEQAVADKKIDFVLTNPGHYVMLSRTIGLAAPLATLIVNENGLGLKDFGGVIFSRAGRSDLKQLGDIRLKRVVVTNTGSLGGYQMQAYELALAGLRLPRDVELKQVGMPHDNVVDAVLTDSADVGFVRSGVLEAMAREGKLDLSAIKVLNERHEPGFPLLHSTRLYPEWPFAALPSADENISRRIAAALFLVEEDRAAIRAMNIHGFSTPSDYTPVDNLLRELRLPPYEHAPAFTLRDVWTRYRWEAIAVMLVGALILALSVSLLAVARRLSHKRLKLEQETRLRNGLLNALGEGVYGVDPQGRCIFINPAALAMLGMTEAEVIGRDQHASFHHHYRDGKDYPVEECPIYRSLKYGQACSVEEWFWRKDGSGFPVALNVSPNMGEHGHEGAVVVFHDITERKQNEERVRHQAQHDGLTGLPNRLLFADRLQQAIASARRDRHSLALMFVDLDKFKPVNDTLGHAVGDWLLQQAAQRMKACVRESDTVARVGGDEFMVLLRIVDSEADAVIVAEKIRNALNAPFDLARQRMYISCSIGIALYPEHARDETELVNHADIAMYHAKGSGRDRVLVFQQAAEEVPG